MNLVQIDVEFMSLNYWDDMRQKNIEYILSNPSRMYRVSRIDANKDYFLDDRILKDTSFSESEIIVLTNN